MYYTDEGMSNYYSMYKRAKEFEKLRKQKKKLAKIRKEKLAKMKLKAKLKLERQEMKAKLLEEKQKKIEIKLDVLKELGYQKGYTPKNPLKRHKRSRDLNLAKEIWEKRKTGVSVLELAFEYKIHTMTVMRHIKEYQLYLNLKNYPIDSKE
jgi:hypothetical protein